MPITLPIDQNILAKSGIAVSLALTFEIDNFHIPLHIARHSPRFPRFSTLLRFHASTLLLDQNPVSTALHARTQTRPGTHAHARTQTSTRTGTRTHPPTHGALTWRRSARLACAPGLACAPTLPHTLPRPPPPPPPPRSPPGRTGQAPARPRPGPGHQTRR